MKTEKIILLIGGIILLSIFGAGIITFYGSLSGIELDIMALTFLLAFVFGVSFIFYAIREEE